MMSPMVTRMALTNQYHPTSWFQSIRSRFQNILSLWFIIFLPLSRDEDEDDNDGQDDPAEQTHDLFLQTISAMIPRTAKPPKNPPNQDMMQA